MMRQASPADLAFAKEYFKRQTGHPFAIRSFAWKALDRSGLANLPAPSSVKILRVAAESCPDDSRVKINLAKDYLELGDLIECERLVRGLIATKTESKWVNILLARLAERSDDWALAKERWTIVSKESPDDREFLLRIAHCQRQLGNLAEVEGIYDRIITLGNAKPVDFYNVELVRARLRGSYLSVQRSINLTRLFNHDPGIAAKHANKLISMGNIAAAIKYIRVVSDSAGSTDSQLRTQLARAHEFLASYDEAIELYQKLQIAQPRALGPIVSLARCIAKSRKFDQALELLVSTDLGENSEVIATATSEVYNLAGDHREALVHAMRAIKKCHNAQTLSRLCIELINTGRLKSAQKMSQRFESHYNQIMPGWAHLATIADRRKDFRSAQWWAEKHLAVQPDSQSSILCMANGLYQKGSGERAFHAILAKATDRPALLSSRTDVRIKELDDLRHSINALAPRLMPGTDNDLLAPAVEDLRDLAGQPSLIKTWRYPSPGTCAFLSELSELESAGDVHAAFRLVEAKLDDSLAQIRQPSVAAGLLYRAATISEDNGRADLCLQYFEEAIWADKLDPMLLAIYREKLRKYCLPIRVPAQSRTCILIVSCKKNWAMASALALSIAHAIDRKVFVVRGDPEVGVTAVQSQAYGFEVVVPNDDGYSSLPHKLTLAYRYIFACTNCPGLLKIDDDCVVHDFSKLGSLMKSLDGLKSDYVGIISRFTNSIYHAARHGNSSIGQEKAMHWPVEYCTGAGYFLSRASLKVIFEQSLRYFQSGLGSSVYEDVYFGELLLSGGIRPTYMHLPLAGGYTYDSYEALALLSKVDEYGSILG